MAITRYAGDRFVGDVNTTTSLDSQVTGVLDGAFYTSTGNLKNFVKRAAGWAATAGGGGGSTDPAGADNQVQFNDNGVFGATTGLTFDGQRLFANNLQVSGVIYDSNVSVGENGMVLTNEGQTGIHWKNIESVLSGVGGSGVANYVARWSDEDTLTSGVIQDNGTAVGINQAPDGPNLLCIKAIENNANVLQIYADDGNGLFNIRQSANNCLIRGYKDEGVQNIQLHSDGVSYLKGGSVGIGNNAPGCELHVSGEDPRIRVDGITDSHPGFELSENGTRKWITYNNYVNDNLTFKTNSDIRMSIQQDGNVGIGTVSPGDLLELYSAGGGIRIEATAASPNAIAQLAYSNTNGFFFRLPDDQNNENVMLRSYGTSHFKGGSVGIGTDTPLGLLHLNGANTQVYYEESDAATNTKLWKLGAQGGTFVGRAMLDADSGGSVWLQVDRTTNTIDSVSFPAGNLGVNTLLPEHKLHVAGDAIISGVLYDSTNSSGVSGHVLTSEVGGPQWKMIEDVLSGVGGNGTAEYIPRWTDSDTIGDSVISQSGSNIGINMTAANPATELHIGSLAAPAQGGNWASLSIGEDNYPERRTQINAYRSLRGGDWDHMGISFQPHTSSSHLDGPTITGMAIDYDGHVGIGTTGPGFMLQVDEGTTATYAASIRNANDNLQLKLGTTTGALLNIQGSKISDDTAYDINLQADGGQVGIGTNNPGYRLDVYETVANIAIFRSTITSYARVVIRAGATGDAQLAFQNNTSTKWTIGNDGGDSDKFKIEAGGGAFGTSPLVCILSGGNFGIGIDSPAYLLHLSAAAADIKVTSTTGTNRAGIQATNSGGTSYFYKESSGGGGAVPGTLPYATVVGGGGHTQFATNNTVKATILTDGNLGIGDNLVAPEHRLHVSGDAIISGVLYDSTNSSGVSGHVLTSEVGGPQWKMIEDVLSGVGGNGTATYIPQWIDSDTIGDSVMAQSGSYIGIGTDAPLELLHLQSTGTLEPVLRIENTHTDHKNPMIHLVKSTTNEADDDYVGQVDFKGMNSAGEETPYGRLQAIATDVTDGEEDGRIYLASMKAGALDVTLNVTSGKVGIATTEPSYLLSVEAQGNDDGYLLTNTSAVTLAELKQEDGDAGRLALFDGGAAKINFNADVSQDSYFNNGGKVGIGTGAPSFTLHANDTNGGIIGATRTAGSTTGMLGRLRFGNTDVDSNLVDIYAIQDGATDSARLVFATQATGGGTAERMIIKSDGKVGIGTDDPASQLHMWGANPRIDLTDTDTGCDAYITADSSVGGMSISADYNDEGSGAYLDLKTANASRLMLRGTGLHTFTGKVGIGRTIPSTKLVIQGVYDASATPSAVSGNAANKGLEIISEKDGSWGTGNTYGIDFGAASAIDVTSHYKIAAIYAAVESVPYQVAGQLKFYTTSGVNASTLEERMTILASGNVGIGTNVPEGTLHVETGSAGTITTEAYADDLIIENSDHVGIALRCPDAKDGFILFQSATNDRVARISAEYNGGDENLAFAVDDDDKMIINDSGNVGIGTTSPGTKLHVAGDSGTRNTIVPNATLDGGSVVLHPYEGFGCGIDFIGKDYGNDVRNYASIYTIMEAKSSSSGGGDAGFKAGLSFYTNGGGASGTNPSERLRIDSAGNVGIGTNNPGKKFEVYNSEHRPVLIKSAGDYNNFIVMDSNRSAADSYTGGIVGSWNGTETASIYLRTGSDTTNKDDGYITFQTAPSGSVVERMRIASDGKVGIGTDDPSFTLHANHTNGGAIGLTRTAGSTTGVLGNIWFGNTDVDATIANIRGVQDGATDSAKLVFQTEVAGGSLTERMVISSTGAIQFNAYGSGTHTGTSAYKLSVDSSGNVIETAIGAGAVDGAGTTNYVSKWTDGDTIGDSNIFDNGTTVGISTTTGFIGRDLAVAGVGMELGRFVANTNGPVIDFIKSRNATIGSNTIVQNGDILGDLIFRGADGSDFLTIGSRIQSKASTAGGGTIAANKIPADLVFSTAAGGSADDIGEKMRIRSDGKVGIGTDAPGGFLSVEGAGNSRGIFVKAAGATTYSAIQAEADALTTGSIGLFLSNSANTSTRSLVKIVNDNVAATGTTSLEVINDSTDWAVKIKSTHATDGHGLYIAAGDDNDSPAFRVADKDDNDKFTIQGDGKVGIGTMAPDFLNLQGNATNGGVIGVTRTAGSNTGVLGNIRFGNTDVDSNLANVKGIQDGATDAAKLVFQTQATGGATSDRMVIKSDGNVGIGTDDPATNLHIASTSIPTLRIHHDSTSSAAALIQLMRGTTDTFGGDAYTDWQIHNVGGDLKFQYNDTAAGSLQTPFLISYLGAVTIGAYTLPTADGTAGYHLQTNGSGTVTWAAGGAGTVTGTGTDNYIPQWNGTTALENSSIWDSGSTVYMSRSSGLAPLVLMSNPANQVADIGGELIFQATYRATSDTTPVARIKGTRENATTNNWAGRLTFHTSPGGDSPSASTEQMRIQSDGNVGIGTTSPSVPLEVVGADSGITISAATANRPHLRLVNGTTNMLQLSANGTYAAIGDGTDANRYMSFKAGSVGVNRVDPSYQLDVNGTGRFTGQLTLGTGIIHGSTTILNSSRELINIAELAINAAAAGTYRLYCNGTGLFSGALELDGGLKDKDGSFGTNGYVLTTDGSGDVTWSASPGAGSVDGSGTANYITRWSDTDTVGNSNIFDNGAIGIGTAANLNSVLNVYGGTSSGPTSIITCMSANATIGGGAGIFFKTSNNHSLNRYGAQIAAIRNSNDNGSPDLVFNLEKADATGSAERMRILGDGNVGIGTNNPAELLHVEGIARVDTGINHNGTTILNSSRQLINIDEIAINAAAAGTYRLHCNGTANFSGLSTFSSGIYLTAGTLKIDDVAESIDFMQSGAINFDSDNNQTGRVFTIGSGRAAGASGGTTHMTIAEATGATTFGGNVTSKVHYIEASGLAINLDTPSSGQNCWITWQDNGANKWEIGKNTGNTLYIHNYAAGASALSFDSSSHATFGGNITLDSATPTIAATGNLYLGTDGNDDVLLLTDSSATFSTALTAPTLTLSTGTITHVSTTILNSNRELINIAELAINAAAAGTYKLHCNGTANFAGALTGTDGTFSGDVDASTVTGGTVYGGASAANTTRLVMTAHSLSGYYTENDPRFSLGRDAFGGGDVGLMLWGTAGIWRDYPSGDLKLRAGSSDRLTITAAGAATFGGALTTGGALKVSYNNPAIDLQESGASRFRAELGSNLTYLSTIGAYNMVLRTNQSPVLTLDSSQNATFVNTATATKFRATSSLVSADNMFMAGGQFYLGAEDGNTDDTYRMYGYDAGKFILQSRESGTWTTRFEIDTSGNVEITSGQLKPGTNNAQSLGNTARRWNLYANTGDFGGSIYARGGIKDDGGDFGTNGQVLTTNGVDQVNWVDSPGAGSVDGSGTANYVSKWTDGDTIGNSQIFDNGTNVGIGIASPSTEGLEIAKPSADTSFNVNDQADSILVLRNSDSGSIDTGRFCGITMKINSSSAAAESTIRTQFAGDGDADLIFSTTKAGTGADRMVIDEDGYVGIGTTNPVGLLDVYSTGSDPMIVRSTSTSRATMSIRAGSGGDAQVRFQNSAASKWTIGNDGGDSNKFKIAVGSGAFAVSEAVIIDTSGNLSILGTLTEASSIAIKENVETYSPSLENISKIRPVRFNKKKSAKKEVGLVAEELAEMFPELVETDEKGNPSGVNYSRAVAVLLHGFKELYKEVKELKEKI